MTDLVLERQKERWYPLIDHPVQLELVAAVPNGVRFPIVPAGRRSGKTERAKRFLAKQAMSNPGEKYFAGAPTYSQAKKIWWDDLKMLTLSATHIRKPSESELKIFMPNGTEIHVLGLDQPQRIEGINWTGGIIDEIADVKAEALEANIMPALNTVNPTRPDYRAWCWFIGVPDGLNHYYDMSEYARVHGRGGTGEDMDYQYFHWTSAEILPPDIIASAKRTMSLKQYRQEYEACHLPDTLIATPSGNRMIKDLCKGDEVYSYDRGYLRTVKVLDGGPTALKQPFSATLETGLVVSASNDHKFKIPEKMELQHCNHLIQYPIYIRPTTRDQALAMLVAWNISDGTAGKDYIDYYGDREVIEEILLAYKMVYGKTLASRYWSTSSTGRETYYCRIGSKEIIAELKELGVIAGKKVEQEFNIPEWIMNHSDVEVRRIFISSLFAAEGSTPAADGNGKSLRVPCMSMRKRKGIEGGRFFEQLSEILSEFGVRNRVTQVSVGGSTDYYVYANDQLTFMKQINFVGDREKQKLAFYWIAYLESQAFALANEISECHRLYSELNSYSAVGKVLGLDKQRVRDIILGQAKTRSRNSYPTFASWLSSRRLGDAICLSIMSKEQHPNSTQMYNILVSSDDHSYVLASGIDNFNSFETATGRIYEDYDGRPGGHNYTDAQILPHEALFWMHDQNYTPLSSAIAVVRNGVPYFCDEIVLESAISSQSAEEFVEKFKGHHNKTVYIYGDPAGRAGEKHGHKSDYTQIEEVLRREGWRFERRVLPSHPSIKDRQNSVRAKIRNAEGEVTLFVNPVTAPWTHKGLATVQLQEGSSFQEDQKNKYQHITTAVGYFCDYHWPVGQSVLRQGKTTGLH